MAVVVVELVEEDEVTVTEVTVAAMTDVDEALLHADAVDEDVDEDVVVVLLVDMDVDLVTL